MDSTTDGHYLLDTVTQRNCSPSTTASVSGVSPLVSTFSKTHSSRSSVSSMSMTSSPIPPRDSFDLYGSAKRLEDVREEPQERDEEEWDHEDEHNEYCDSAQIVYYSSSPPSSSPLQMEYCLRDQDAWSTTSSGRHHFKRQRSTSNRNSITDRVASRFGSISRRWKSRSLVAPQLSVVTQSLVSRRSSSVTSAHIVSPALSAISKHESHLPVSPLQVSMDETLHEQGVVPLFVEPETSEEEEDDDQVPATTPLLPPTIAQLSRKRTSPLQSPLQSPSIAAVPCMGGSRDSGEQTTAYLPSPPLSTRPSMASLPRSPSALQNEIPPLTLYEESVDPWDSILGHANFSIHPEPYVPEVIDVDNYREFRANWELARKQYAQHITRTTEHYGETSRVYKLTQQKWDEIDNAWMRQDTLMSSVLSRTLARVSDGFGGPEAIDSPSLLEKPITRVIVPTLDQNGKFPEIGDADIVGPLAVAPAKAPELQRKSPQSPPFSPRKRNLFKYLSDVLSRHNTVR